MDDIEARLREFRPKRPAAIPDERVQWLRGPVVVAVAAGLVAVLLIVVKLQTPAVPSSRTPVPLTLGALTTMAVVHPDELDAAMTEMSRTTLPDVSRPGGVLQPLAEIR